MEVSKVDAAVAEAGELERKGDFMGAAELLGRAVAAHGDDPALRLRLARVLGALRERSDEYRRSAIEQCRLVESSEVADPSLKAQACFLRGSLLDDRREEYEEAVEAYSKGLELDASFPVAHNNLGAVLCELGRLDEAERHFFQAIEQRPYYTKVCQNLAKLYFRRLGPERLRMAIRRLSALPDGKSEAALFGLVEGLVAFSRQDAYEDFYARGHRLKNLFAVLAARTRRFQSARSRGDIDEAATEQRLRSILDSLEDAKNELKDFLALVRPGPAARTRLDVNELVLSVVRGLVMDGIDIRTKLDDDIPPVLSSSRELWEALNNLGRNAVEAVGESGTVVFSTHFDEERQEVSVTVDDSGPGVPPGLRMEIFRPGFTTRQGGNGIGLSVVRRLACELGGRISVADSELGGASFMLSLPAVEGVGALAGIGLGDALSCQGLGDTSELIVEELTDSEVDAGTGDAGGRQGSGRQVG